MNRERVEELVTAARVRLMEVRYLLKDREEIDYAEIGLLCHEAALQAMRAYLTACGNEPSSTRDLPRLLDELLEIDITCDPLIEPAVELEGLSRKVGGAAAAKRALGLAAGFNKFFLERLRSAGYDPAPPTGEND